MVTNINTILSWFRTGLKPTQAQFWASWTSFWHKDEIIPQSSISNLTTVLNAKAEKAQFDAHQTDVNAHTNLFAVKENKSEKGQPNGYAPLDSNGKILINYLNVINDLVTGGASSLLTAEQGKVLQTQINAINALLSSDNVDLDSVQELVDAIENIQMSLSTILVNDLITGGVAKALTAEQGKVLKGLSDALAANKVDKVAGERLISASEITKLAGIQAGAQVNQDISGKQDINNQIYVGSSGLVDDSWHGKMVTFTATCTITVPATGLRAGFKFDAIVDPAVTVSTVMTAPKAWFGSYTGADIPAGSIFTFIQRSNDSSKISIYGL